jgi:hypothetical protein
MSDLVKDVHTEHCCKIHGCKYSPDNSQCSVASGDKAQSFPCEHCADDQVEIPAETRFMPQFQKTGGGWCDYFSGWGFPTEAEAVRYMEASSFRCALRVEKRVITTEVVWARVSTDG